MRARGAQLMAASLYSSDYLGPSMPTDEAGILKQDLNSRPQCVYSIEDFRDDLRHFMKDGTTYTYSIMEDGNAILLSCDTNESCVIAPDAIEERVVTTIASSTFYKLSSIEELTLPKYADCIGRRAIFNCKSLKTLILPQEIDMFSSSWIKDAKNIERIVLPKNLQFFPAGVFNSCTPRYLDFGPCFRFLAPDAFVNSSLEAISIDPQNQTFTTDGHAIYSKDKTVLYALATPMESYTVDKNTRDISKRAFAYMSKLTHVDLPDSIYAIRGFAFMCSGLETFKAPQQLSFIGAKAFLKCAKLTCIELNDTLERISTDAFEDTAITELYLPARLEYFGFHALWNTPILHEDVSKLCIDKDNPYMYLSSEGTLYRRAEDGKNWIAAEQLDTNREVVSIDEGCIGINEQAFARITKLKKVIFPKSLKYIDSSAFYACSQLSQAELPHNLEKLGEKALCLTAIENIRIPATLQEIGHLAISTYKNTAIIGERSLKHIYVEDGNKNFFIESGLLMRRNEDGTLSAILYAGDEPNISIPQGTTCIEAHCFAGAEDIDNLHIPTSVKYIQQKAFNISKAFKSITLDLPYDVQEVRMHHTPLGPPRVIFASECNNEALLALVPESAHSLYLEYPQNRSSVSAITYAFLGDVINPATLVHYLDAHVSRADNLHFWAMHMLSRLKNPVLLDESHATLMRKRVFNNLEAIISDFAKKGTIKGFEYLFDLNFFDEKSIQMAIDISTESKNAHSTSYLLELQENSFGRRRVNFDL